MPNLQLHGLELSERGVAICQTLEKSKRLPLGCVQQGSLSLIPYPSLTFDMVYCRLVLQGYPYLPNTGLGIEGIVEEMYRVTAPQGLIYLQVPEKEYRNYLVMYQCMSENDLHHLASKFNLRLVTKMTGKTLKSPDNTNVVQSMTEQFAPYSGYLFQK